MFPFSSSIVPLTLVSMSLPFQTCSLLLDSHSTPSKPIQSSGRPNSSSCGVLTCSKVLFYLPSNKWRVVCCCMSMIAAFFLFFVLLRVFLWYVRRWCKSETNAYTHSSPISPSPPLFDRVRICGTVGPVRCLLLHRFKCVRALSDCVA